MLRSRHAFVSCVLVARVVCLVPVSPCDGGRRNEISLRAEGRFSFQPRDAHVHARQERMRVKPPLCFEDARQPRRHTRKSQPLRSKDARLLRQLNPPHSQTTQQPHSHGHSHATPRAEHTRPATTTTSSSTTPPRLHPPRVMVRLTRANSDAESQRADNARLESDSEGEQTTPARATRSTRGRAKPIAEDVSAAERDASPAGRRSGRARAGSTKKSKRAPSPAFSSSTSPDETLLSPSPQPALKSPARSSSTKKGSAATAAARKGSDVRRAETAAQLREESARLERLYKETTAQQDRARESAAAARPASASSSSSSRGCTCLAVVLGVAVGVFLFGWTLLFSFELHNPTALSPSTTPVRLGVEAVSRAIAETMPRLKARESAILESALLAHAQAFEARHSDQVRTASHNGATATDDEPDTASVGWVQGSAGLLQASKPLVFVLASTGGASRSGAAIVRHIATGMPSAAHASPLAILDLSEACRARFGAAHDEDAAYAASLTGAQVREVLRAFFASRGEDASSSSSVPSLAHGLVYIPRASELPRAAAEVFHRLADDVRAPVRDAAFLFEVDVRDTHTDTITAVADELRLGWAKRTATNGNDDVDEVIEPLLSRIMRNVVDLRGLPA